MTLSKRLLLVGTLFASLLFLGLRLALPTAAESAVAAQITPVNISLPVVAQAPDLTATPSPSPVATPVPPFIVFFSAKNGSETPADHVRPISMEGNITSYDVVWGANVDLYWQIRDAETITLERRLLSGGAVTPLGARPAEGTEALTEVTQGVEYHLIAENGAGEQVDRYIRLNIVQGLTPVCGISINQGALYTTQRQVTLHLTAAGANPTQMMISNDGGFGGATWQPFQSELTWTLPEPGIETSLTVYARFACGLEHGNVSDDIIYAPSRGITPTPTPTLTPSPTVVNP